MLKKALAMSLAVFLLLALAAGCGDAAHSPTDGPEASAQPPMSDAPQDTEQSRDEPQPAEPEVNEYGDYVIDLPLCEETVTFTYFYQTAPFIAPYINDYNELNYYKGLEEATNVRFEFDVYTMNAGDAFNVMAASGEYKDVIIGLSGLYNGGAVKAIEDEIVIDLAPAIDEYCPNYKKLITSDPELYKEVCTDEGLIANFGYIYDTAKKPNSGVTVRKDWLDELGLDIPVTYEDYFNVLSAFKAEYDCKEPLYMSPLGVCNNNALLAGYKLAGLTGGSFATGGTGFANSPFYVDNGEIHYGFAEEGFRDYLTMMNSWYEAGLFTSDFVSNPVRDIDHDLVGRGDVGMWVDLATNMEQYKAVSTDPEFEALAIPDAVMEEGGKVYYSSYDPTRMYKYGASISTQCENLDIICKAFDYMYTHEGFILANYGLEGVSFEYDENNEPVFIEAIFENEGMGATETEAVYTSFVEPAIIDPNRFDYRYDTNVIEAYDIWLSNVDLDNYIRVPTNLTLTIDESLELASLYTDIETHATEILLQVIMGDMTLEDWDECVDIMYEQGLQRCIDIVQAAMDRYLAK